MQSLLNVFYYLGLLSQEVYRLIHSQLGRCRDIQQLHAVLIREAGLDPVRARRTDWLLTRTPAEVLALIERFRVVGDFDREHDERRQYLLQRGRRCQDLGELAQLLINSRALTEAETFHLLTLSPDEAFSQVLIPLDRCRTHGPDPRLPGLRGEAGLRGRTPEPLRRTLNGLTSPDGVWRDGITGATRMTDWQARALLRGTAGELRFGNTLLLLEPCGRGGIAQVYRAWNVLMNGERAVKVFRPDRRQRLSVDEVERWRERWWHEASTQSSLDSHPRIADIFSADIDSASGEAYIEMAFIRGISLDKLLAGLSERNQQLSVASVCRMGLQMLDALGHMHRCGLIHRDFKHHNVMWRLPTGRISLNDLPDEPDLVLMDFCFARRLRDHAGRIVYDADDSWVGTPGFRAPELANGVSASTRSDLFAFGQAMTTLLHGSSRPKAELKRAGVPSSLARLLDRLTNSDPAVRPLDCPEVVGELHRVLEQLHNRSTTVEHRSTVDVAAAGDWTESESLGVRGQETSIEAGAERELVPGRTYSFRADPTQLPGERLERLGVLLRWPNFRRLSLEDCQWADDFVLHQMLWHWLGDVQTLELDSPGLRYLDLSRTAVTDRTLALLHQLRNLGGLSLRRCAVTADGLRSLAGMGRLSHLRLGGCSRLSTATILTLAQATPGLDYLEVSGAAGADDSLEALRRTRIRHLRVSESTISRAGTRSLERCESLQVLEMHDCKWIGKPDLDRLEAVLTERGGRLVIAGRSLVR